MADTVEISVVEEVEEYTIEINEGSITVDSVVSETGTNPVKSSGIWTWVKGLFTTHATETNAHPASAITFTVEEITGTDTLTATDSGKHFFSTAAADINVTVDEGLTHPISIFQKGNGVVTIITGSGTPTLVGNVKTGGQNFAITVVPESTTVYEIIGGVA